MQKILLIVILFITTGKAFSNFKVEYVSFTEAEIINDYTTRIPFKLIDHLIVVEAKLLGKEGNFIIDTGSETLILNKVHFPIKYSHNKKKNETSGVVNIVDDPLERQLSQFVIQNLILENKTSDVIDLSHIERTKKMNLLGVIGYNILKDYEVFIDLYLNQITLTKTDRFGEKLDKYVYLEKITDSIDFKLKNHTIVLNATVNGQNLKMGLDSAAELNQINKSVSKKVLKYFHPKERLMLTGASNSKIEVLAGKLHRVKLSETIYFGPMNTILTNLSKMNEAFGTKLDGVLGFEFFQQKRTIINYKKEKLYFVKHPNIKD
ncbi:hypothetical protein [Gaetbulibacter sp. PBL-D1]|uniref:hypothetical protein n=1 Tax=Gaetbulibacter sp. PBL-D1 TaxID=3422594 RepID=UPI003D2EFDF8